MFRHAEIERQVLAIVESGDPATGIDLGDAAVRHERDVALGEGRDQRLRRVGRGRHRARQGKNHRDLAGVPRARLRQEVMQQKGALARRGRAFVRRSADPDDGAAFRETRQDAAERLRACNRVELVDVLEPRRRGEIVVRAERHDEEVALMRSLVGGHPAAVRIDRRDQFAEEPDARLDKGRVRQPHAVERRPPEHHVELGITEHEGVAFVDDRDIGSRPKAFRQQRGELEAAKSGAQNQDTSAHGS